QSKYNIQSDGVVGMQTSTALLIACNNNPTCKSAPTSSNFETKVVPVVNTKMQEVANSPAMQQINKAGEPDSSRPPTPPPAPPAPGQPTPPIPTSTPPPLKPASVASSNYPPECSNGEILIVDVCVPSQLYTAQSTATSGPIQQIVIKDTIGRETTYLPTGPTVSGLTQGIMIPGKDVKPGTFLPYFYTTMEGNTYFLGYQYDDINGKTHYIGKQEADEMSVSADLNQLAQSKSGVTVYRRPTPSASSTVKSVSNPQDWSQQSTQPSSSNDFTEVSEPSVQQGSSHDIASSPKTPVCICEDPCYPDLVGQTCLGDDPTNVNCIAGSISATCS
ncbi:MAG: hypothetical protein NT001_02490, partial [Candidatus Woesearchaeota archaeon]|nr:hypothetical protein [Candidatus Woesearchaeota archaeon]